MIEISEDVDLAYALSLQEELEQEQEKEKSSYNFAKSSASSSSKVAAPISVVDDSWELIDPIPDVRQLFLQFNDTYFKGLLGSVEVRWSPRMTLCAGLCCYEGRGGLCSIRLSQPLLKLRPRKDLVQTLLHEMIHALLFVTQNNKVNVYRQHWWKCDGLCRKRPPYYGMVKRAMNRAPSPRDTWWADHQRTCGGTYTKIKEPENYGAKKTKSKQGKEKSDSETEMAKGKGQGNETGTLPKFFKRKKVDSDDDSSDLDNNRETGKKRKKGTFEDSDNATSITGGVVKSNISQPGSSHWTADVIPFSGSGRTLGSNSAGNITSAEPQSGLQGSSRTLNKKTNGTKKSIIVIKTPSPAKPKKTPSPTLTILDAFQRAKDKNKDCKNRSDDFKSPVLGSQRKPIELGDSPSPVIREVASTTGSPDSVQCPVCQALVLNSRVNQHLDSCLE